MVTLIDYLNPPKTTADTNESILIGTLLAYSCLMFACQPLMKAAADSKGGGGSTFWDFLIARQNNKKSDKKADEKDDKKEDKSEKVHDKEKTEAFNSLVMIAKKANEKEKNENDKKKTDALLKLVTACSFDKDGNEIPLEDRIEKMKDTMTPEQFESFKKDVNEVYEKHKDDKEFKESLVKAKESIKPEDYDKMIDEAKKEAKDTLAQIEKERKEIDEYEQKIKDLEEKMEGVSGDEKKELKDDLTKLQQNPPQTIAAAATGVNPGSPKTTQEPASDPKPEDDAEAKLKAIDDEYKEKSKELEAEYEKKIADEKDEDKKKELEDEWMKKEKQLSAERNKKKDDIDDNDEHKDDDETKNGKYTVKDEEIEDENGNKIKVKTYTGPRGGKFYYPEGKPKKPENKVYVESQNIKNMTLVDFLKS